jgi:hypothetical protein
VKINGVERRLSTVTSKCTLKPIADKKHCVWGREAAAHKGSRAASVTASSYFINQVGEWSRQTPETGSVQQRPAERSATLEKAISSNDRKNKDEPRSTGGSGVAGFLRRHNVDVVNESGRQHVRSGADRCKSCSTQDWISRENNKPIDGNLQDIGEQRKILPLR